MANTSHPKDKIYQDIYDRSRAGEKTSALLKETKSNGPSYYTWRKKYRGGDSVDPQVVVHNVEKRPYLKKLGVGSGTYIVIVSPARDLKQLLSVLS